METVTRYTCLYSRDTHKKGNAAPAPALVSSRRLNTAPAAKSWCDGRLRLQHYERVLVLSTDTGAEVARSRFTPSATSYGNVLVPVGASDKREIAPNFALLEDDEIELRDARVVIQVGELEGRFNEALPAGPAQASTSQRADARKVAREKAMQWAREHDASESGGGPTRPVARSLPSAAATNAAVRPFRPLSISSRTDTLGLAPPPQPVKPQKRPPPQPKRERKRHISSSDDDEEALERKLPKSSAPQSIAPDFRLPKSSAPQSPKLSALPSPRPSAPKQSSAPKAMAHQSSAPRAMQSSAPKSTDSTQRRYVGLSSDDEQPAVPKSSTSRRKPWE